MRSIDPKSICSAVEQARDLIAARRRVRGLLDLYGKRVVATAVDRFGGVAEVAARYDVPMTRISAVKNGRERISASLFARIGADLQRRPRRSP